MEEEKKQMVTETRRMMDMSEFNLDHIKSYE
jgi:hypothetical protein